VAEHLTNRVTRAVEGRARGLLPFLPAEGAVAGAVALLGAVLGHLVWGLVAGGLVLVGTGAARRRAHGRADYLWAWARRQSRHPQSYSLAAPDPLARTVRAERKAS